MRHDGLHPDGPYDPDPEYNDYLRSQGYEATNPWEHWANSGEAEDGALLNGWLLAHSDKPARVPNEHSETPWTTRRAMEFINEAEGDRRPWCLHLSYIKPHWPYIVPAPYHDMYGRQSLLRAVRSEAERLDPHPVYGAFMQNRVARAFSRDEVRERVLPAYMGLIKQIDDQFGLLLEFLEARGLAQSTMIVFTSDHGDYLGDHWLGEKQLFHDASARVPLIIYDPDPRADGTRGTVTDALVEMIDLAPTFLEFFGGNPKPQVLEGRSLLPLLKGETQKQWRRVAVSEFDYSFGLPRILLGTPVVDCRMVMVTDGRWKMVHTPDFRPMLYDLAADPNDWSIWVTMRHLPESAPDCARRSFNGFRASRDASPFPSLPRPVPTRLR